MVPNIHKQERSVIHLQLGDVHEYFGSLAAIYDVHSPSELGISYGGLRNYGVSAMNPYENDKCTIRKGVLRQKVGGRGRKSMDGEDSLG